MSDFKGIKIEGGKTYSMSIYGYIKGVEFKDENGNVIGKTIFESSDRTVIAPKNAMYMSFLKGLGFKNCYHCNEDFDLDSNRILDGNYKCPNCEKIVRLTYG